jgi:hypothetical protein
VDVHVDEAGEGVHTGDVDLHVALGALVAGAAGGSGADADDACYLVVLDGDVDGALGGGPPSVDDGDVPDDQALVLLAFGI